MENKEQINYFKNKIDKAKDFFYDFIKLELKKRGGRFNIDGELWDGRWIRYIKLNSDGAVVISGVIVDTEYLWSAASVEDLYWIVSEMID